MKCPYASSGCNYPEGECLGVCWAETQAPIPPVTYQRNTPAFWPVVSTLITLVCISLFIWSGA